MKKYLPLLFAVAALLAIALSCETTRTLHNYYHSTEFSPPEPVAEVAPMEAPAHRSFHLPSSEVGASISSAPAFIFMDVSAYCPCELCCGKWADGSTASGKPAIGRICAAPPEYPFGTVLHVEGMGEYVVQDRGGAIKGNKLDLLMGSHEDALRFGRKDLKVMIVR